MQTIHTYRKMKKSGEKIVMITAYDFPSLIEVCEALSRAAVVRAGGRIEKSSEGVEEFVIPVQTPVVGPLEQCWDPAEIKEDVHFTPEEMEKITITVRHTED